MHIALFRVGLYADTLFRTNQEFYSGGRSGERLGEGGMGIPIRCRVNKKKNIFHPPPHTKAQGQMALVKICTNFPKKC